MRTNRTVVIISSRNCKNISVRIEFEVGEDIKDTGLLKLDPVKVLISAFTLWNPPSFNQTTVSPSFIVNELGV